MKIKHLIGNELISIFKEIINQKLNIEEWSLIESSEQFQTPNYSGGFEATENEFTFSYFDNNRNEFWFQLPLNDIYRIIEGNNVEIYMTKAEDY